MKDKKTASFNIILLGDPGAGKATQAAYFAKKYKMLDYDMGRELTIYREKNKTASNILKNNYDKGVLAPTQMVRNLYQEMFDREPLTKNILFDGTPKMLGEAKFVRGLINKTKRKNVLFIYLGIPEKEIYKRVLKRKGYAGTKFKTRFMDTEAGLKERAKYYNKDIKDVVAYFSKYYGLSRVSGLGTRTEVRAKIQKVIDKYLKTLNEEVH